MLDFTGLSAHLLSRARDFLQEHVPGGFVRSGRYYAATIHGGKGDSFSVCLKTGRWADFAFENQAGHDLISLYAAKYQIKNGEAAKCLADRYGFRLQLPDGQPGAVERKETKPDIVPPPEGVPEPQFTLNSGLEFQGSWLYRTADGSPWFYVARYLEQPDKDGKRDKTFRPFSYSLEGRKWTNRSPATPRPLYNLHDLSNRPDKPVLVVEGEKCAEAAHKLAGTYYVTTTWPNGAKAWEKADWEPLAGRHVLIWPDAGPAGQDAGQEIQRYLAMFVGVASVKLLDVSDQPDGWDVADFTGSWEDLLAWARPRAKLFEPPVEPPVPPEPLPAPVSDPEPSRETPVVCEGDSEAIQEHQYPVEVPDALKPWAEEDGYADEDAKRLAKILGLARTSGGAPICSESNLVKALSQLKGIEKLVWYDSFHQAHFTLKGTDGSPREWTDDDDLELAIMFQMVLGLPKVSEDMARRVVRAYCRRNERNGPQEWVKSLTWDGKERVPYFFESYMGCGSSEYTYGVSQSFWVSMIARIFQPGCKCDTMVILQGPQGIKKSSAMEAIGGPWYVDCNARMSDGKDFFLVLRGKFLIELSELDSFRNAEQTRIKQVLSCRNDVYRVPYGHRTLEHPRSCVFVGTTNAAKPGRDVTGSRRFYYLHCRGIDLDAIRADREQLFAEAYHRYRGGERWWAMVDEEVAGAEAEERREVDVWEDALYNYVNGLGEAPKKDSATAMELLERALGLDIGKVSPRDSRRLSRCMTALRWEQKGTGKRGTWYRPRGPKDWYKESEDYRSKQADSD
jgi:predicted P-loop ATPase